MNIVKLDSNASIMNARNHARLTKIVMTKVIMAHIVILITKFVLVNVQKIKIALEDTNVRMDTVSNLVQSMANVLLLTNIATGRKLG